MRVLCLLTLVSICQWSCQGQQLHARALRQADLTAVAHAPSPSATLPNQAGASKVRSVDLPQMLLLHNLVQLVRFSQGVQPVTEP